MSHHRRAGRGFALGFIAVLVVSAALPMTALAKKPAPSTSLGQHDEQLLAEALDARAAPPSRCSSRPRVAPHRGRCERWPPPGTVRYQDAALGYIRADVPTGNVKAVAADANVQAVDLDETLHVPDPRPDAQTAPTPFSPPDAATPRDNPYMPIGDTGAAAFIDAHPTWDGRGVTVRRSRQRDHAGPPRARDHDHRRAEDRRLGDRHRLAPTRTDAIRPGSTCSPRSAGRRSRSTASRTRHRPPARTASRSSTSVTRDSAGRSATTSTATATQPAAAGSSPSCGITPQTPSGSTPTRTSSFADQTGMTDYRVNRDVGFFGTDNPATADRRVDAVRGPDRRQEQGRQHRHRVGVPRLTRGGHRRRQRPVQRRRCPAPHRARRSFPFVSACSSPAARPTPCSRA